MQGCYRKIEILKMKKRTIYIILHIESIPFTSLESHKGTKPWPIEISDRETKIRIQRQYNLYSLFRPQFSIDST